MTNSSVDSSKAKIILYAVTSFQSHFLVDGLIQRLCCDDFSIHFASSPFRGRFKPDLANHVKYYRIKMLRNPSILSDIFSLISVFALLFRLRPSIVNYSTPKASLIYSVASYVLRIPRRVYLVRGLRYESIGPAYLKSFYTFIERLICLLSTHVVALSNSVEQRMIVDNISTSAKTFVVGPSGSGTPFEFFSPNELPLFKSDEFIIGFCGRFVERKGVYELFDSIYKLRASGYSVRLLMLGSVDNTQPLDTVIWESVQKSEFIDIIPFTSSYKVLSSFYNSLDLFVLPAYWEGFGNVLVEAAFHGVPVVTTRCTGCVDAVKEFYNASLVPPADATSLYVSIVDHINNPSKLSQMAANSSLWSQQFSRRRIADFWLDFYRSQFPPLNL